MAKVIIDLSGMKQIFDWLREQMRKEIVCTHATPIKAEHARITAYENAIKLVNEAEAKWEADCCELLDKLIAETPRCRHGVCEIRGEEACVDFEFCENCLVDAVKDILTNKDSKFRKIVEVE